MTKKAKHEEAEEVKVKVETLVRDIRLSLGQLEFRDQTQQMAFPSQTQPRQR